MATPIRKKKSWRFLLAGSFFCLCIGLLVHHSRLGAWLDAKYFDVQTRLLRHYFPTQVTRDVLVVGIDEATVQAFDEPMTLWHRHYGDFLRAMNAANASAIGLDIALPERSFNDIVPGYDESLMTGILAARKDRPLVFAITSNSRGEPRALYRKFELLAGKNGLGFALFPRDIDQRVRRFDERLADDGSAVDTLVGQMARGLKLPTRPGYIDASVGPAFDYIPLHDVVSRYENGDIENLRRQFAGKPVLLGTVLPVDDRLPQAVNLAGWEANGNLIPGVLLHAQTLRNLLNHGLLQTIANSLVWVLILLSSLWWSWSSGKRGKGLVFVLWATAFLALALYLHRAGIYLPLSAITATAFIALIGRLAIDALAQLREQRVLKQAFGSSVSPDVLEEILSGQISPELGGSRKFVGILFSDVRGFTTRSEAMTPEAGIDLLNRYFECVVEQIHANDGAVLNFMGDGIMAIFGSPKPLANPCAAGFAAAKAMQHALVAFNEKLKLENIEPIEIGVGVHAGEVVVGNMGSSQRNNYTAIGDAANVASRVEGLTKEVGYGIVCTKAVVDALPDREGLIALGPKPIKGHTPVEVYGWLPAKTI